MCSLGGTRRLVSRHRTTACLWRQCSTATGRAFRGAICPSGVAIGRICTAATAGGLKAASGDRGSHTSREMRNNAYARNDATIVHVHPHAAGRKGRQEHSVYRAPQRRTDHSNTRRLRGARQPDRLARDAGTSARSRRGGCVLARSARKQERHGWRTKPPMRKNGCWTCWHAPVCRP